MGEIVIAVFVAATVVIYIILTYVSVETMHVDQRAWLNVTTRAMDRETIKVGVPINGRVLLSNTGKTAAKKIFSEFEIQLLESSEAPDLGYDKSGIRSFI
jgi:hypothetical protein